MEHEAHICFVVLDFGQDPSVVTAVVGFEPTEAWLEGQPMRGNPSAHHTHSRWMLKSPLPLSASVEDHLEALLSALEPHAVRIREAACRFSAGISCAIYFHSVNPGFHISNALAARVAAIGLGLDFDLYCLGEESRDAEPDAPPNGGPATRLGNSGVTEGPPSVS